VGGLRIGSGVNACVVRLLASSFEWSIKSMLTAWIMGEIEVESVKV
jgi:hypothetical protein